MDYHYQEVLNTTKKERKIRKGIMQRFMKERRQNHDFQNITRYIGKSKGGSLRILHIKDQKNIIIKTPTN